MSRDPLEIRLLGGFAVQVGSEPLPPLASRVARMLLAYLVLRPGLPQPRSVLADLFWPDAPEARGRRRLSHALWQLQDALAELAPGRSFLETTSETVAFDSREPYWLDVTEFESRLDRVDAAGRQNGGVERDLRRAVELYQGDLLAGHYDAWVAAEQQRLEHRYLTALSRLVEVCRAQGNLRDALNFARRVTHLDPLREDGHREVMRLCVLLGQPSQALEQYERCRSVLAEELGAEPAAETVALYEQVAAARRQGPQQPSRPRHLVSDRLVGRQQERTALVDVLERALGGRSGVALVEGPPGVGKTQLLAQVADDATWRGFTVLWGACQETTAPRPYAPIRAALEPELQPVRTAQLQHALDPVWRQQAAHVLRPLAAPEDVHPRPRTGPLAEAADLTREALSQVVVELARQDPVLLVLDDVQWADHETLALLSLLARRQQAGRLVLLLGFRDREARGDRAVWDGLRDLDRNVLPSRVSLEPLSAFEVEELVADVLDLATVPGAFTAALRRESGGNPLYVLELLRSLRDTGVLTEHTIDDLAHVEVPITDGLRAVMAARLTGLVPAATRVVELAAVLGAEFPLRLLAAATGLEGHDLTRATTALLDANVLQPTGDDLRFTHAVTRRVVLEAVDADRLADHHRAAAGALAATGRPDAERLAAHLLAAGEPRRAIPHLQEAVDQALQLDAYATAAQHLRRAIAAARGTPTSIDLRYGLLIQYEQILDVLGRRDDQDAVLDDLAHVAAGHPDREVDVLLRRALHLGATDRLDPATRTALDAADRAEAISPAHHGRALAVVGQLQSWAGDNLAAIASLQRALELVDATSDHVGRIRFALGTALRFVQRYDEAATQLHLALGLADARDDHPGLVQSRGALADLHTETGEWDQALRAYDEAIQTARRLGYRQREAVGLVNRGNLLQSRGRPHEALSSYAASEAIFEDIDSQRGVAMVQLNRAWLLHRWLGADEHAQQDAERAQAHFAVVGNHASQAVCLETLAAIARRRGDTDTSRTLLARALAAADDAAEHRAVAQVHRGLAATLAEAGDHPGATDHVDTAMSLVVRYGLRDLEPELHARRAELCLAADDPDGAWSAASTALQTVDVALEPHRVLHAIAQVAAATGHRDDATRCTHLAHQHLAEALATLEDDQRARALAHVRAHRDIEATAAEVLPRAVTHRFASDTAPRGRALGDRDLVTVHVHLGPSPHDAEGRRRQVREVIEQARVAHALPTVADLAQILEVSPSTIHRDLRALRACGFDATTRGTGVG